MGVLHALGGAAFAMGWFIFFDGLVFAKRYDLPYNFVAFLPGVFCLLSIFVMYFAKPDAIVGGDEDMDVMGMGGGGGMYGDSEVQRSKGIFFFAATLGLAGLSVAIWQMSDRYKDSSHQWAGVALLVQTVFLVGANGLLFAARKKRESDALF